MYEALPEHQLTEVFVGGQKQCIFGIRQSEHGVVIDSRIELAHIVNAMTPDP